MMYMIKSVSFIFFFALLCGCTSSYKAPLSDDVAKILINRPNFNGFSNVNVFVYPKYSCLDVQLLGNFFTREDGSMRTTAVAGEDFVLGFEFVKSKPDFIAGGSVITSLERSAAFIPEKNVQYEIKFESQTEPVVYKITSGGKMKINSTPKIKC